MPTKKMARSADNKPNLPLIVIASSFGTIFEWYDFYIFGTLASVMAEHFFKAKGVNDTTSYIFALLAFAAGFLIRPFGAIVFGRIGDLVGRKYTFLVTMGLMGFATFAVGLLPTYSDIGLTAPVLLIGVRLVQGLALGGEYGGAATYVAEHAAEGQRGFLTSWIQTTATLGLLLALVVIGGCRVSMSEANFNAWGWRIPFLSSAILLAISIWIRFQLSESPVFQAIKDAGQTAKAPLAEAFANWTNLKIVLVALFGLIAGQGVVWYTGQFFALNFLEKMLKLDMVTSYELIGGALCIGTPFFVVFGWLSDHIGRKPIILAGLFFAIVAYFPIFHELSVAVNPALVAAEEVSPIKVFADPKNCSPQFDPAGVSKFLTSCDIAKSYLASAGISYDNVPLPGGSLARIRVGKVDIPAFDGRGLSAAELAPKQAAFKKSMSGALADANYPAKVNRDTVNVALALGLLTLLVLLVTMVYGPMAAALVEMFPARIRYTSMSLPYHIGNGWFGGLLPAISFAIVAYTGRIYDGLWYPVIVAGCTLVIGLMFVKNQK